MQGPLDRSRQFARALEHRLVELGRKAVASRRRDVSYRNATSAIRRHLAALGRPLGQVRFEVDPAIHLAYDVRLTRSGANLVVGLPSNDPGIYLRQLEHRLPYLAYWLLGSGEDVETLTSTLSDGDHPTLHRFAPSTNLADVVPLPDPYFFGSRGFDEYRRLATEAPAWLYRSPILTWRGAMTGTGLFDAQLALERPALAAQRMAATILLRGIPETDVRFATSSRSEIHIDALRPYGIVGDRVPQRSWINHRYGLDIDGHTNTWSNLIVRLHMGCCMLKVESRFGYRQWYYDRLRPWEHFVPVQADLSDLVEKLDWVRTNDREAEAIAARGQALARSLDWDSVSAEAVKLVTENWNRPARAPA